MNIIRLIGVTGVLALLTSCASFSRPVDPSFKLQADTTVVYGRFAAEPYFTFGNQLALRLLNEKSGREHLIRFDTKKPVCSIVVEPGQYRINGFVATYFDHRIVGRRRFPDSQAFKVTPNSATYIGDFIGYAKLSGLAQEWGVKGATNNFAETTKEFHDNYQNLAFLPTCFVFESQKDE